MATISITTDPVQTQRVITAFGRAYGLGRDATASEVKQFIINYVKGVVQDTETAAARSAITSPADMVAT